MDISPLWPSLALGLGLWVFLSITLAHHAPGETDAAPATASFFSLPHRQVRFWRAAGLVAASMGLLALLLSLGESWGIIALSAFGLLLLAAVSPTLAKVLWRAWPRGMRLVSFLGAALFSARPTPDAQEQEGDAVEPPPDAQEESEDEAEAAEAQARQREMIRSIRDLHNTTVREIMVPRVDIVAVDIDTPISEVVKQMVETGHGRILVYRETIDQVVGIAHSLDLLGLLNEKEHYPPLRELVREPFFVPEAARLDDLLREFQERRARVAVVVDEYGGTEGFVTIEDLLEEIVGDIEDEFSHEEQEVVMLNDNAALVDARASLDEVNERMGTNLQHPEVDTIGGFVYAGLGRIPHVGARLGADGVQIEVVSTMGHRLRKLRITRTPPPDDGAR